MSTYRDEKLCAIREMFEVLVAKGWKDVDLSYVDFEATVDLIISHEALDLSESSSPEEVRLGEMRGLLRALYLDGSPVFAFDDQEENDRLTKGFMLMARAGDGNVLYEDDECGHPLCPKQVKRSEMILRVEQISVGQWLWVFIRNVPAHLIQVTSIPSTGRLLEYKEWGKLPEVKEAGWLGEGILLTSELGLRAYPNNLWETCCWVEEALGIEEIKRK